MKTKITFLKQLGASFLLFFLGFSQSANAQTVFSAVTQTQAEVSANQPFALGTHNQRLLRIDFTTSGSGTATSVITQFDFTVTGNAEISKITVVRGSNNNPDLATTFGFIDNPGATASVTGSYTLTGGTQFFALVDIKSTATVAAILDIECTVGASVTVGGNARTIAAPGTNRNAVVSDVFGSQTQAEVTASQPFGLGTRYQRLLRINVNSGDYTQLDFNVTGSAEISKIVILRGGYDRPDFALPVFGSVDNPGATASVTGSFTSFGTTQFFALIDLKSNAIVGNTVDIECTGITVGGISRVPTLGTMDRNGVVSANLSGIKTIKATGGDYVSLKNAFLDINNKGFGGAIELVFDDDITYTQGGADFSDNPFDKYLRQSPTVTNTLTIRRSGTGTNRPIINTPAASGAEDVFLGFHGSDYVTIDGLEFNATGATSGTKLENGITFRGLPNDGCSNNVIKNCIIKPNDTFSNQRIYGVYFKSYATELSGSNKNNKIFNNTFTDVSDAAICFNDQAAVTNTDFNDEGNEIYNNTITGRFGVQAGGIYLNFCKDSKIYNNTLDGSGAGVTYNGSATKGISTSDKCTGSVECFGNTVKNIKNNGTNAVTGISLNGNTVRVYNNMVSNLTYGTTTSTTSGIQLNTSNTLNPDYYVWNNSVYLNQVTGNGKTIALNVNSNQLITGIKLINNIFVNTSTGTAANNYVVYSLYTPKSKLDATSDNNLYYPEAANFIYYTDGTYATLALYKAAMGTKDQNSVSDMPAFTSASDLHITSNSTLASNGGKPVAALTTDIDGDARSATTPDMGADEFNFGPNVIAPVDAETGALVYIQNNQIVAELSKLSSDVLVSVIDVRGAVLKTMNNKNSSLLTFSVPSKGVYLVRIQNGEKLSTHKIVLF